MTASYGYDPLGNRVSQTVNGVTTNFQIDPTGLGNVVATFGAGGALTAHYTYGLGLVSQVSASGVAAYYDFNNIGSTVGITGTSGTTSTNTRTCPSARRRRLRRASRIRSRSSDSLGVMNDGSGSFTCGPGTTIRSHGQFVSQ